MKRSTLEILCCPADRGDLAVQDGQWDGEELQSGSLVCQTCGHAYPVEQGIPNLLPPGFNDEA